MEFTHILEIVLQDRNKHSDAHIRGVWDFYHKLTQPSLKNPHNYLPGSTERDAFDNGVHSAREQWHYILLKRRKFHPILDGTVSPCLDDDA